MNLARCITSSLTRRATSKSMSIHATLFQQNLLPEPPSRHFSQAPPRAMRRRKRGESSGTPTDDLSLPLSRVFSRVPTGITDALEFADAAQNFLDKIEASLLPMEQINDIFILERTSSTLTLTLAPELGQYVFEILEEQRAMRFVTPLSGGRSYLCNAQTGEWECQQDGHRLEGMLVRDLLKHVNGLPDL